MVESSGESRLLSPQPWNLLQFGLLCTYTLGFSGVWTFPSLVYQHTGLFLVAYYILLVGVCFPVTFVQLKLGGLLNSGFTTVFSTFVPALKGVSVSLLLIVFVQLIYQNVYVAYALYYMFACLANPYPWAESANSTSSSVKITDSFIYFAQSPGEDYFFNKFLQVSPSLSEAGAIPWYLGISLLAAWCLVFAMICRGPGWLSKVVYGTGSLGILLLSMLLIYGHVAVPKAQDSLHLLFKQKDKDTGVNNNAGVLQSQLAAPLTWIHALEQHVYNIGLWAGILPTMGKSFGNKKPSSNLTWLIILLVHGMIPHLATIAMVPFIHALAVQRNLPFDQILKKGPMMMFIFMPEAFAAAQIPSFWAFSFYLFFIVFALHKQAMLLLVVVENIIEAFPKLVQVIFKRRELLVASLCAVAYLLGLPYVNQGGWHLLWLVENYLCRLHFLPILLSVPPFVLAYVRQEAYNLPIERLFLCIWFAVATLGVCAMLLYNLVTFVIPYPNQMEGWTKHLGGCISVAPLLIGLPVGFAHAMFTSTGTVRERFKIVWRPKIDSLEQLNSDSDFDDVAQTKMSNGKAASKKAEKQTELEVSIAPASNGEVTNL